MKKELCLHSNCWRSFGFPESRSTWRLIFLTNSRLQAKEFGEAEVWMNERLMRAAPGQFAEFVTAFEETQTTKQKAKLKRRNEPIPLWLVWKFEGDFTLWNLMVKKEFPYNVEPIIYGKELRSRKGAKRSLRTIKAVMLEVNYLWIQPIISSFFGNTNFHWQI